MKNSIKHFIVFLLCLIIGQTVFAQFDIPKKPSMQTSVYDGVELLSESEKIALENKLIKYSDSTSTQIVVAIIHTTQGEDIGYLATNWAHQWGIGQEKEDNGVFVLLAQNDKKITIRTGYGVEHLLTDFTSRQIIEYDILPYFKKGHFYAGIDNGVNSIFKVLEGEYENTNSAQGDAGGGFIFFLFIVLFIVFIILMSNGGRGNRGGGRGYHDGRVGRSVLETIILTNSGRGSYGGGFGGGFGGSSGGGGFGGGGFGGGFGGGGFGGGGATGGW